MASVLSLKEDFLTCAICMEYYIDPCTLGCEHSFCRKCLTDFLKTRSDAVQSSRIPCASCRQDTMVPNPTRPVEEWAGQFKPSLMLTGLMDKLQSGHKHREGQDVCCLCEKVGETTPATTWCCNCEATLCSRCVKMHLKAPYSMKHNLRPLTDGVNVKQRRRVKCSEHEGELIKYICKDCNTSACQICCIIKHRACTHVDTIESMISEMTSVLIRKKRYLEKKMQVSVAYVKQEESKLQQLKDKEATTGSKIKSEIESFISVLRKRERELLKRLGDVTDKHISQYKANIRSGEITTQMCQKYFELIDQILQSESEMDMYEMYEVCQSRGVTSVGDTESDTKNTTLVREVSCAPNIEPVMKSITEMGRVDVTCLNKDTPMLGRGQKLTPVLCDTIDIKHRDDPNTDNPIDVTVLTVNSVTTVVTAEYKNKRLKSVYTEMGTKIISVVVLSDKPRCIDRMTGNRVAATVDDFQIVIAEVRPELVVVSFLKTRKQYCALTSLSDSTLAAGSCVPQGIDILDLRGNVMKSFTPHNTGLNLLQNPHYMCTSLEGNILVTDKDSKSVYCLTRQGDVFFKYTSKGKGHGQPMGIAVTDTGDILLSTYFPNSIILLASSGTFINKVLTSTDGIGFPWGMCVHDRDKLYVCKRGDNGCVKVFRFT